MSETNGAPRDSRATAPGPRPVAGVLASGLYRRRRDATPIELRLDGNEGAPPPSSLLDPALDVETLRRYPDARPLESLLAQRLAVAPEQVVVTAGADEALDRIVRAFVPSGGRVVLPAPTFEMLEGYVQLAEADVAAVEWRDGPFPRAEFVARACGAALVAVVSPNNPTGAVATAADLVALSEAAPDALLLVDLAYAEFADEDLTRAALALKNALVVRTLSKAYGLAGLRVGYAVGRAELVQWLRSGSPFPVSGPALALAQRRLERPCDDVASSIARVRVERELLARRLGDLGARAQPSQANFVLGRFRDAAFVRDALAGLGVAVRGWPVRRGLEDALRITCPGDEAAFARLDEALAVVLRPQALLLDLDGVVADVTRSFDAAIRATAASFGVALDERDVAAGKARGDANDDWSLTRRLLAERGVDVPLEAVTARFEALYQGDERAPGLHEQESMLVTRDLLGRLARRLPLAIVTGRPRRDALRFLERLDLTPLFSAVITRDDAPLKPDPRPVRLALERLGVSRAWMVGDTPDDVRAARAARVLPLAVLAPGRASESFAPALLAAGAGRILASLDELAELLP